MKVEVVPIIRPMYNWSSFYGIVIPSLKKQRGPRVSRIYIVLKAHNRARINNHRSHEWMVKEIMNTLDHEFSHVFEPPYAASFSWERQAHRFERAGAWTRRP